MANNLQTLNQIISLNDNTDDLLEQQIKENERVFDNLDINKSNDNLNGKESRKAKQKEINHKIVSKNSNKNKIKSNNILLINNKIENLKENNLKNKKKILSKENSKINDNNELLTSRYDNSFISSINNQSIITNKTDDKISFSKKDEIKKINLPLKKKTNLKNINNYEYIKNRQTSKNKLDNQNNKRKILKDNVDFNLYTQYKTLYIANNKRQNHSLEKRNRKKKETNISKSRDKSRDKSEDKFKLIYKKFLEDEYKRKGNIERMKKKKEEEEKKIYIYKPQINNKSKKLFAEKKENKEDFYTRQKKLMDKYKKNEELLREKIKKQEDDIIKKSAFSKQYLNNKEKNENKYKHIKSKLFDWVEKYNNDIINNSSKKNTLEKENSDSENNKTKYKIKVNRNINKIINRLYKKDIEKRKQNLEILNKVYTPSFTPILFNNRNNNRIKSINYQDKFKNSNRSTININPKIILDDNIENEEEKNFDDNNITYLIRNKLFNRAKQKELYKSEIRLNVICDENIYVKTDEHNLYKNKTLFYQNRKASSSFIKQQKKYKL